MCYNLTRKYHMIRGRTAEHQYYLLSMLQRSPGMDPNGAIVYSYQMPTTMFVSQRPGKDVPCQSLNIGKRRDKTQDIDLEPIVCNT